MRRGDVYWVDLDPTRGGEIGKRRPAAIVSNDGANQAANQVQVVPLTSNTTRVRSWEVLVRVNNRTQKALADQVRTVAKERLTRRMGALSIDDLLAVEKGSRSNWTFRHGSSDRQARTISPVRTAGFEPARGSPPSGF